mmetsp:Transcript_115170/g.229398  ORF Transcript_115170/g.229398 Transcript_115170/m.229398 type:complete len:446 (-) Transcript_115170:142-1479(-)
MALRCAPFHYQLLAAAWINCSAALLEPKGRTTHVADKTFGAANVGTARPVVTAGPHRRTSLLRRAAPGDWTTPREGRDLEPYDHEVIRYSLWKGKGMDGDFRFLDDVEPVAPMDQISTVPTEGIGQLIGTGHIFSQPSKAAQYVQPYLFPDAFPAVHGPACNCQTPPVEVPTDADKQWAATVRKQIGRPVTLPNAPGARGRTICTCEGKKDVSSHWWTRAGPTNKGQNFSLMPADATYGQGNYWAPSLAGGLAAPFDRLPPWQYPLQADADHIANVPSTATEDYISRRYARYMDQLEARKEACDKVSKRCTVPCGPDDEVSLNLGNTQVLATVVSADPAGGAFVVRFAPTAARGVADAKSCPLMNECTAFRMCHGHPIKLGRASETAVCVDQTASTSHNWKGLLKRKWACPPGTTMCSTVEQMVTGDALSLSGKACRVKPPEVNQ